MKSVGGFSNIFYSLKVASRVGVKNILTAIFSKNACKTCALGMGGQLGGMRNEAGDFPQICKKSFQAQLTDIQGEVKQEFFQETSLLKLRDINPRELERLGRLNYPLHKKPGDSFYSTLSWEDALKKVIEKFKETNPARTFFYSSGRSSNEAAFLLQLFARMYGTNNINNCSYYCHQASGVGIGSTIGVGTATIQLHDLKKSDLIFVIGSNPSSNHPRYMTELMECNRRGGNVIVINPSREPGLVKFTVPSRLSSYLKGGSKIASLYIQPHIGGDIALLKGIAKTILIRGAENTEFISHFTNHFEDYKRDILDTSWEDIFGSSGVSKETIEKAAEMYIDAENTVFSWAMGVTHHTFGSENVESIVNLALLRGMVGKKNAGLLPLRGHSNVQGVSSVGLTPQLKARVFENIESYLGVKLPESAGMDTIECMNASEKGEIDLGVFLGGNLYASNPDSVFAEKALNNIPFKLFLNTTLNQGHLTGVDQEVVILPVQARDEEKKSTTQESMFNYVRLSDGGIIRLDNVRSEVDILADIASGVLGEKNVSFSEFKNHRVIRKAIARAIPGFEKMESIDDSAEEFQIDGRTFHEPKFATSDKKANFRVVQIPGLNRGKNEFMLMTVRSEGQFNSIIYDEEDLFRGQNERWIVLMNPSDLARLGLKENDPVTLENSTGRMDKIKVREFNIKEGNILTYFPEANILVPRAVDPRSKTPGYKSVRVKVYS